MDRTVPRDPVPRDLGWMVELGVSKEDLVALNPCVPGEFTLADKYYVNTGSPRIVYRGTEEGTLPLVVGRWYLIPGDIVERNPSLRQNAVAVAQAVRLTR